jgi:uncharacterized protein (TIGR00730 family)
MSTGLSICVFCGFSSGHDSRFVEGGRELGTLVGERGHALVYGAAQRGLMGAVAEGAAQAGAHIVGVIPEFLRLREQADELPEQELVLTGDLFERKRLMIERADGFIALPGGYGTLDEVIEVVSMAALGVLTAPIALVDIDGVWAPLVDLIDRLHERGFLRQKRFFTVVSTPADALNHIEAHAACREDPELGVAAAVCPQPANALSA